MDNAQESQLIPSLPNPTTNFKQALKDIVEHGICIIPDVLTGDSLKRTRDALYRAAESDRSRGREADFHFDYGDDQTNQRIWNVLSRDPVFEDLAFHEMAVRFVKEVIGWPALLNNISANITGPGSEGMMLHADQLAMPEPWSSDPQGMNVAWCIDDFTAENGATLFVPGSHKLNRGPRKDEADTAVIPATAPAGSIVVFESRIWHKTGSNRTKDQQRAGIFSWYTKPIYRTQENWFLSLRPEIRDFATDEMLVLLGYKTKGLGLVHGKSPA